MCAISKLCKYEQKQQASAKCGSKLNADLDSGRASQCCSLCSLSLTLRDRSISSRCATTVHNAVRIRACKCGSGMPAGSERKMSEYHFKASPRALARATLDRLGVPLPASAVGVGASSTAGPTAAGTAEVLGFATRLLRAAAFIALSSRSLTQPAAQRQATALAMN